MISPRGPMQEGGRAERRNLESRWDPLKQDIDAGEVLTKMAEAGELHQSQVQYDARKATVDSPINHQTADAQKHSDGR